MHFRYLLALLISIVFHGLLFVQWQSEKPQASSKGSAHILLLEDSKHWQSESQKLVHKKQEDSSMINAKTSQQQTTQAKTQANQIHSEDRRVQFTKTGQDKDLSGTVLTAEQSYRNAVIQHLLTTMEEAPTLGQTSVTIWLMPSGIAYKIKTDASSENQNYKDWVKKKVLSANPYPPIPEDISTSNLMLRFEVSHQADDLN